jgi:hypothetical protein
MRQLATSISRLALLRDALLERYPEIDDETLRDTLEGLTDFSDMIAVMIRSAIEDAAMAKGLKGLLEELRGRLERLERRADKKRELAQEAMEQGGYEKLTQPDFTASLRQNRPTLTIIDEAAIPEDFWLPQPPKLSRTELRDALERGVAVPGALLGNATRSLSVRIR